MSMTYRPSGFEPMMYILTYKPMLCTPQQQVQLHMYGLMDLEASFIHRGYISAGL